MRLELVGGAYYTRGGFSSAQRCINWFPESNRKDSLVPWTYYRRPGNRNVVQGPVAPVRGLYRASNGNGYCVIGQGVYSIAANWKLTLLGNLTAIASNLVSFTDNGTEILLVDGSPTGYSINLATNAFAAIVDPTGIFTGSVKVATIDGFLLWVIPASQDYGSTLPNELVFNATYFAAKNGNPDNLVTLFVNQHEIYLFGSVKSEIWYNSGGALFPFALLPGSYIEHGILALYSLASIGKNLFWLGQDLQGDGYVLRQSGYTTTIISNYAISYAINQMKRAGANLSDAIGYTYNLEGHSFYVLTFLSGDQTWVYDMTAADPENAWHQRGWTDANGILHRERANCSAFINNQIVIGDWQNGGLMVLDNDYAYDDVAGLPTPITVLRTFSHLRLAEGQNGPMESNGKLLQLKSFSADFETGYGQQAPDGTDPSISLRLSVDRGKSWSPSIKVSAGKDGQFDILPNWKPLGLGRFPGFELSHSLAGPCSLCGAWIETTMTSV